MKTVDFSETIAASDLKVGRCRQLIEFMKLCEYRRSRSFLYHIFSRFCMFLCFTRPRYQVSVYRTIGPRVYFALLVPLVHLTYCTTWRLYFSFFNFYQHHRNQRTNGPVNAHLISWPSKAQKHTKPGKYMVKK